MLRKDRLMSTTAKAVEDVQNADGVEGKEDARVGKTTRIYRRAS